MKFICFLLTFMFAWTVYLSDRSEKVLVIYLISWLLWMFLTILFLKGKKC